MPNSKLYIRQTSLLFIQWLLVLLILTSMIFALRFLSSICIGLLLITTLLNGKEIIKETVNAKKYFYFTLGACLLFSISLISILYSENKSNGWATIRIQTGLALVPVSLLGTKINNPNRIKLLQGFCVLLAVASVICLSLATYQFNKSGNNNVFYYHSLVAPLKQHAVYFSILIFAGLVFLTETALRKITLIHPLIHGFTSILFGVMIILLSSKLVILFLGIYIAVVTIGLFRNFNARKLTLATCLISLFAVIILLAFRNPVSQRFSEITGEKIDIIKQEKFNRSIYFNGLQFRLLQWRIATNILYTEKVWFMGLGVGDAQSMRDRQYEELDMYLGDPKDGSKGYQLYNSHNQVLETLLQTGLVGLLALLILIYGMIKMISGNRERIFLFPITLLIAWMFTESVFETQYGILYLMLFPLLLNQLKLKKEYTNPTAIVRLRIEDYSLIL